jgi:[ribosomal protein S18]-alanine N-acetyltransferase
MHLRIHHSHERPLTSEEAHALTQFLHEHLDTYGDAPEHIRSCIDYASGIDRPGGLIITATNDEGETVGAAVVCKTGMHGYIPDNILVYLAVRADQRGKGLGRRLITEILEQTEGDIALHVEADNPARRLYEREGFTTPYLEMRWKRSWPS